MDIAPYRWLRLKYRTGVLTPKSTLSRLALVLLVLVLALQVLHTLLRTFNARSAAVGALLTLLTYAFVIVVVLRLYKWIRQRWMWRLRNRLIVTYVFIGVIPVLLLALMAIITGYLFTGQFATFIITNDIHTELKTMDAATATSAAAIAQQLERDPGRKDFGGIENSFASDDVTVWYKNRVLLHRSKASDGELPQPPLFPAPASSESLQGVVWDGTALHLRAMRVVPVRDDKVTVVSSTRLDPRLLGRLAASLGEVSIYAPQQLVAATSRRREANRSGAQISTGSKESGVEVDLSDRRSSRSRPAVSAGVVPPQSRAFDREVTFPTPFTLIDWSTGQTLRNSAGKETEALLLVTTRPSMLFSRLFLTLGEFFNNILVVLEVVAIFFALIELLALFIGLRLTRTMTRSVAQLYEATQHVNRGDFSHRIAVKSSDQLAALETSFNSMTVSLQRLLEEQKEKQRLESELALGQEVQALLFPRDITELESLEVHGVCRPARTVSGDYYDFLPVGPNRLGIAVGDISGKGISAALLMATVHAFVRAYTLVEHVPSMALPAAVGAINSNVSSIVRMSARDGGELPPGTLLAMLNHQLYRSTPTEKYATLFLSFYDARSRQLTYSNAGHLPPIVLSTDGTVRKLESGGMVVGLFGDMTYEDDSIEMNHGDIFIAYSDGITEPENEFGEFGEDRLVEIVYENRHLPLVRITDVVTAAVADWIGGAEQPDDVTLVLARAR